MKFIILIFLLFGCSSPSANGGFGDRIKARLIEKQKQVPPPTTDPETERIEKPGDYTFSVSISDLKRFYKIHIPKKYSTGQPMPLLLALHGGGGDMSIQATEDYYHQISKSESRGFIVVFPNGPSAFASGKLATWNAGLCCGYARDNKIDDVAFLKEVIAKTRRQLSIDSQRIFATGMSNGAMMAYRLACELPDTIRAIAAVAGTDNTSTCEPKKPISILHIHAKNDGHVLYTGGAGKHAFKDRSAITEYRSVPSTIERWRILNKCEARTERVLEAKAVYCDRHPDCADGTRLQLCVTEDGGHSWPGGSKVRMTGDKPSMAISANDVMWAFFDSL